MKALTTIKRTTSSNAWGRDVSINKQIFEIEAADIGKELPNYLGHGQKSKLLAQCDLGKTIEVMTDTGYHCWSFNKLEGV